MQYNTIQVEPAQGGGRKFPGLRTVTQEEPKARFAYRRCRGPSQLFNSVLWIRRHFASPLFNCDRHFSTLLRPSQLFSIFATLLNSSQSCSISSHLSSTLFTSSLLFSTLLNDSHLALTLLSSSQLVSTLLTSCHSFNSSHLFSPPLNSSHLFHSSSQLFSPSQLWPTLLDSSHLLSQICLHTEQAFPRRSIYIYPTLLYSWLHDLLRHMPTGH